MKTSVNEALVLIGAMGAVIFFTRAIPFIFFSGTQSKGGKVFLDFVERIAPPVAMTVLAFNALGPSLRNLTRNIISILSSSSVTGEFGNSIAVLAAAILTTLIHLLKRNPLISIFTGTAVYMILQKL